MQQASETSKFRKYDAVRRYLDSEMTRIMLNDDNFDEDILKMKETADDMLNQ